MFFVMVDFLLVVAALFMVLLIFAGGLFKLGLAALGKLSLFGVLVVAIVVLLLLI